MSASCCSSEQGACVLKRRAKRAVATVCLLLIVLIGSGFVLPQGKGFSSPRETVLLNEAFSAADPFEALEQIDRRVGDLPSEDIAQIEDEISISSQASSVRWNAATGVFGFEVEGAKENVFATLSDAWLEQGWCGMPLGDICGATFLKNEGTFRWMAVSCTQVGSTTCVVGKTTRCLS